MLPVVENAEVLSKLRKNRDRIGDSKDRAVLVYGEKMSPTRCLINCDTPRGAQSTHAADVTHRGMPTTTSTTTDEKRSVRTT